MKNKAVCLYDTLLFYYRDAAKSFTIVNSCRSYPQMPCLASILTFLIQGLCLKFIIRKSKCSTDFKRNDFLKKNEAYPLGALRSLKFAYRKLRISLFVELAV